MKLKEYEGLDEAIKEFNEWNHAAVIYVNMEEKYFATETFPNDVAKAENCFAEGVYGVASKNDRDNNRNVGQARRAYIEDYVEMLEDGYSPMSAEYQLMDKHRALFMY